MAGFDRLFESDSDQSLSSKALTVTRQEFAYSTEQLHKPWRPWTLTPGTLLSTATFSGSLAVVLGILQWRNARRGALFFASTADSFSFTVNFLYRYLPTIIIVLYGMAFSWIDLDVKRLEPWFQLARTGGSEAEKSLLLQYPIDFLLLYLSKAARFR